MENIGQDADHLAGLVITVAWNQGLDPIAVLQEQVVKDTGTTKTAPQHLGG